MDRTLRRALAQRQRTMDSIFAKASERAAAAMGAFADEFGIEEAENLAAALRAGDKQAEAVLRDRIEGLEDFEKAEAQVIAEYEPAVSAGLARAVDVRGELRGRNADLVQLLPESRRDFLVDRISADAALDDGDGVGALAAMTCGDLPPGDPRWERAFAHVSEARPEPDPRADWTGDKADSWLREFSRREDERATDASDEALPSLAEMRRDIKRWEEEDRAKADAAEKTSFARFFPEPE